MAERWDTCVAPAARGKRDGGHDARTADTWESASRAVPGSVGPLLPENFPLEPLAWQRVLARCRMAPQQARVAELLLYGLTDKQIATQMGLSVSTIRVHLNRLFYRAGTDDRHTLAMRLIAAARMDVPFTPWR